MLVTFGKCARKCHTIITITLAYMKIHCNNYEIVLNKKQAPTCRWVHVTGGICKIERAKRSKQDQRNDHAQV